MLPVIRSSTPPARRDGWGGPDEFANDLLRWLDGWRWPDVEGAWKALGDLEETDDEFVLEVDLPGVAKGDVDVQVEDRRLTVTAERKERERIGVLRRRTRHVGTFHHEVLLPTEVDADRVEAQLRDGVLTVRLPKTTTSTRHKVAVR